MYFSILFCCSSPNVEKSDSSEPPSKRLRCQRLPVSSENEQPEKHAAEDLETNSQFPEEASDKMVYFTELIIFGNERECLLVDGEYELVLHDKGNGKQRKRKQLSWETDYNGKVMYEIACGKFCCPFQLTFHYNNLNFVARFKRSFQNSDIQIISISRLVTLSNVIHKCTHDACGL